MRSVQGATKAQEAGLRFEKKVTERLNDLFPSTFLSQPKFRFTEKNGKKGLAIPDGILLLQSQVILIEIKLKCSRDGWYQLRQVYEPVVRAAYPWAKVRCVEIVKWFDPWLSTATPVKNLKAALDWDGAYCVFPWGRSN